MTVLTELADEDALFRPKIFSKAELISPTGAWARAARIDRSRRFPLPVRAHSESASSADETLA